MTPQKHVDDSPTLATWDAVDRALGEIRKLNAEVIEMEGSKALGLKVIQDRWDSKIQPLNDRIGLLAKGLQEFAEFHREDMGGARSKEMTHGRMGFRLGNPKLMPLAKKTWDWVLALLKEAHRTDLIRVREEVNKEAFSAITDNEERKRLGVRVVQEDWFFYEIRDDSAVPVEK